MRRGGTKPPEHLAHFLVWYKEIRNQTIRGYHYEPLQFGDVIAYREAYELWDFIGPWEISVLMRIDIVWRKVQPKPKSSSENEPPERPSVPRRRV